MVIIKVFIKRKTLSPRTHARTHTHTHLFNAAGVVSEEVLAGTETDPRQKDGKEGDYT